MTHTYECALRWADMDLLGHVNNVRYLDLVAAAREALFAGHPAGRAEVRSHRVEFLAPLVFRRAPITVDSWVTASGDGEAHLAHEVYDEADTGRTVHLRVSTVLRHDLDPKERALAEQHAGSDHAWREVPADRRPPRVHYDLHVRPSDLGARGTMSDSSVLELLQESRVRYLMGLHTPGERWTQHVIARTDVDYRRPIELRPAPYDVASWIGHLGGKSFSICAEVRDGEEVLAEATVVVVAFDTETQRPAPMAETQRTRLQAEVGQTDA